MVTALPAGTGVESLSAVTMEGKLDDAHGAGVYLVAQQGERFCVVDELLTFDEDSRGGFEDEVVLEAEPGRVRVRVTAHRVMHESLDADESASGVSDVVWEECDRYVYEVSNGRLSRIETQEVDGPCPPTGAASAP